MNIGLLFSGCFLFILAQVLVWFSTNAQFMSGPIGKHSLLLALVISLPLTLICYYAGRFTYDALGESAWAVRFIAFGTSWVVFPLLTWWLLKESMFDPKTLVCTFLAFVIVAIQLFWK
tara:strand:- start:318 stop:671 length:354 start_codon:yes stop_codon:yes gene_type:complete